MSKSIQDDLEQLLIMVSNLLLEKKLMLVTAESCTGGLIAASCTEITGSSEWFDRGFVTYSNKAKSDMLDVPMDLILQKGAVSSEVAEAMAKGAYLKAGGKNKIAVSVTGIAGPDGGSLDKPVGTVWIAISDEKITQSHLLQLSGNRQSIREATVINVFDKIISYKS